jgi:acyl carrier protein
MADVFAAVADLIGHMTDVPVEEISVESRFEDLDNWTSFAALRLLTGVEERLGVRLDLRGYLAVQHVGELVSLVAVAQGES